MIFNYAWVDQNSLKSILQRSFDEFNVTDQDSQQSMYEKYSVGLGEKKLINLELVEDGNLVASALSSYQEFYADCGPLKLSFLTQVIVQQKYRGRGHLRKLMEFAQVVDEKNSSLASIVIARKRVGNLYSRFGYFGFGVFPHISIKGALTRELHIPSDAIVWEKVYIAYQSTYKNIPGSIYRSSEHWNHIRNEINRDKYGLVTIESGKELAYLIFFEEQCYEIASTSGALYSDLLQEALRHGIRKFRIGANHPFFPVIFSAGGEYVVRPEREEGHMLKPYFGGEFFGKEIKDHMTRILSAELDEEKFSIDINLLNEW
jgi:predicted acetyltransferase